MTNRRRRRRHIDAHTPRRIHVASVPPLPHHLFKRHVDFVVKLHRDTKLPTLRPRDGRRTRVRRAARISEAIHSLRKPRRLLRCFTPSVKQLLFGSGSGSGSLRRRRNPEQIRRASIAVQHQNRNRC